MPESGGIPSSESTKPAMRVYKAGGNFLYKQHRRTQIKSSGINFQRCPGADNQRCPPTGIALQRCPPDDQMNDTTTDWTAIHQINSNNNSHPLFPDKRNAYNVNKRRITTIRFPVCKGVLKTNIRLVRIRTRHSYSYRLLAYYYSLHFSRQQSLYSSP